MMKRARRGAWWLVGLMVVWGIGCGEAGDDGASRLSVEVLERDGGEVFETGEEDLAAGWHRVRIDDEARAQEVFDEQGVARFELEQPARQMAVMMGARSVEAMMYRAQLADGSWGEWSPVRVFWHEGELQNVVALSAEPAVSWEVRGIEELRFADFEFSPTTSARLAGDRPLEEAEGGDRGDLGVGQIRQGIAPADLVTSRHQWGAEDPDKICNSVVAPYRMTLHHTAGPTSEGGDSAARMRQIQNFHIEGREWCDIGYHFVVDHYGEIFQGRVGSDRPAAHVGGENAGNVGVSMIGTFTEISPPASQIEGVARIMGWVHKTHGVELDREAVKGHREWPSAATLCPGDRGLGHLDDILEMAEGFAVDPEDYAIELSVMVEGLEDFYSQGSSQGVVDALEGQQFGVELWLSNQSPQTLREVELAYELDAVGLRATAYRIESDHPDQDQSSWELNDATNAEGNPAVDAPAQAGVLTMHSFSPGETKRVVLEVEASEFNVGRVEFSGIRGWIHNIEGLYEGDHEFGEGPAENLLGQVFQVEAGVDVFSTQEWQFLGDDEEDLEGWTAEGATQELWVDATSQAMSHQVTGAASVVSPEWTSVDAESFDELVLGIREPAGEVVRELRWSGDQSGAMRFSYEATGEVQMVVVPVGDAAVWAGSVDGLEVEWVSSSAGSGGTSEIEVIYFQNRTTGETSSVNLGPVEGVIVEVMGDVEEPDDGGVGEEEQPEVVGGQRFPGVAAGDQSAVVGRSGCVTVGGGPAQAPAGYVMLMILGFVCAARRKV